MDAIDELRQQFIQFDYVETKDLAKHFLTLVSGVLVFSIAFSEKIIGFARAKRSARYLLIGSWVLLLLSIVFCGIGLCFLFAAAAQAMYPGESINKELILEVLFYRENFFRTALIAWNFIMLAGVIFTSALLMIIIAAVIHVGNPNQGVGGGETQSGTADATADSTHRRSQQS